MTAETACVTADLLEDLADGVVRCLIAVVAIDGVQGWVVCEDEGGAVWAYAPPSVLAETGEVARALSPSDDSWMLLELVASVLGGPS